MLNLRRSVPQIILVTATILIAAFSIYLWTVYKQLDAAFGEQKQFIPTRIYSDVTHLAPPQSRSEIESRLKALGYTYKSKGTDLTFELHTVDYPAYLLPEGHVTPEVSEKRVNLHFDDTSAKTPLQSIQASTAAGPSDVADIYLEPELVATLSRSGQDVKKEIRTYLQFDDIPTHVGQSIIAIEDPNFWEHSGLDPKGIARAIFVDLKTLSLAQGGSTLTMQLVKNLTARRSKNIIRKVNELFLTILLEVRYDKKQILERYLNEVYLGQIGSLEIHGVAEGARHFFGKDVKELNLAETAVMAGLIRGPGFYSPYHHRERIVERQKLVLSKMAEKNFIAEAEAKEALATPLRFATPQSASNKAPFFTDFVKAEMIRLLKDKLNEQEIIASGFKVYTTLDSTLNLAAQRSVSQGILELEKKLKLNPKEHPEERLEGALAAVDHNMGYIRALVGGRSYAESSFNRILNMRRQVGSTFKPFVYLAAFEKGTDANGTPYGPGYPVEDAAWTLTYDHGKQNWTPRNYEKEHLGWISMRTALAKSINTVAAKLGVEVGIAEVQKTARALGIDADLPAVPSLSLGVAELSPVELVRAYATIANHGIAEELTVIRGITQADGTLYMHFVNHPSNAFPSGPIDLLTDTLHNVFTEGTAISAARLGFDRPAAGKTGTTSNYRDAWFAGFTPEMTAVVWVGADQTVAPKEEKPDPKLPKGAKTKPKKTKLMLTGGGSALPIWTSFMNEALAGLPPTPFTLSQSLTMTRIDRMSGKMASPECPDGQTLVEKYVTGKEPTRISCEKQWPPSQPKANL
ncbi:MAG: transglycosylase domain-containing protein [Methylotenera sp.]|nr:transglycosylase domain-containing protein [Oligoflexia bacterium]